MKKISYLFLVAFSVVLLSACTPKADLDYVDFQDHFVDSYEYVESIQNERYVIYYYGENCGHCAAVKIDILNFFQDFDLLPFYLLETGSTTDVTTLDEFYGTPTVFVMANGVILDSYVGDVEILRFIDNYKNYNNLEVDYNFFGPQFINDYDVILNGNTESYLVYFFDSESNDSLEVKDDMLQYAFTQELDYIYFIDKQDVLDVVLPSQLSVFNTSDVVLLAMTNGVITETHSTVSEILHYLNNVDTE